jgi:hypothetical protein
MTALGLRGMTPDLGVRACVRMLSLPNPNTFDDINQILRKIYE